jgi:hypothetical protein
MLQNIRPDSRHATPTAPPVITFDLADSTIAIARSLRFGLRPGRIVLGQARSTKAEGRAHIAPVTTACRAKGFGITWFEQHKTRDVRRTRARTNSRAYTGDLGGDTSSAPQNRGHAASSEFT